jgi:hypothetical protein
MIGLFLYNEVDLNAEIAGGVQICSKEFLSIIENTVDELHFFKVRHSKSILFRILYKLNLDNYLSYQPHHYKQQLKAVLENNKISHVFINKSELLRFSKLIKEFQLRTMPKIIIMSHGNESGDLLGNLTNPNSIFNRFSAFFGKIKLGLNLYTESLFRKNYVDLVCTMSEEESAIEKWLGINNPFYTSRLINKEESIIRNPTKNIFGYVGTLNHTPNISALTQLFDLLKKTRINSEIRIVGQPIHIGENLEAKYSFVKYLGGLKDDELLLEVKNWKYFINPIFYYSRGASMKLAKAIEWQIPIITTIAGKRGYVWQDGSLIETGNTPIEFANEMLKLESDSIHYNTLAIEISKIKQSTPTALQQGKKLRALLTGNPFI